MMRGPKTTAMAVRNPEGEIVLEKKKDDMTVEGDTWACTLGQEDTKKLLPGYAILETRLVTTSGTSVVFDDHPFFVEATHNKEVLT